MTKKTAVKKIAKKTAKKTGAKPGASRLAELTAEMAALEASQYVVQFLPDGTVLAANDNFLRAMGYSLDEVKGQSRRMFVDEKTRQSAQYLEMWAQTANGRPQTNDFRLTSKTGQEVWVHGTYTPLLDAAGKVTRVVGYLFDITEIKRKQADSDSQLASISANQAVIEFKLDGTIVTANENFLNATGYTLSEIQGRHHSIFVDPDYRQSVDYRLFWEKLASGRADNAQYRRIRKDGKDVWLQASYNPIFDLSGKPVKVVKYATDITPAKSKEADSESQLKSISTYQAVIEFKLDGTIVNANQNFLNATGYTLAEIQGRPHSIFVDAAYKQTQDYRLFWDALGRGQADSNQYKRICKNGSEVWLQASYCPIFDLNGKPAKVIKYATDITEHKKREQQMMRAMAEVGRVMAAVSAGDLSDSIKGEFDGEFAKLRDSVNSCVDSLGLMMSETCRVMKAVADGDLREAMQGNFAGEFGTLRDSVNTCVEHLRRTVEQIRHGMSTMTVSATEIATGNLDLSQRTEEQAASLATTAANMEEITGTVKQNADNAREANMLASGARQQAERGGAVVNTAITAMAAINEASKRIADIIGVIDDIAFQTNLLALNAAVEAARAGEQGRGFAVVASEVRNLAQRSAAAAKEIKGLIKDSVGRVDEGSRLVNESGSTLEQIMTASKKVSDIVAEIAAASSEQSAGIEKITEAVQQMDIAVQQNSALVEETAAASNMMDDQTRSMSALVDFFKLSDNDQAFSAMPKKERAPAAKVPAKAAAVKVQAKAVAPKRPQPSSPRPNKAATVLAEEF